MSDNEEATTTDLGTKTKFMIYNGTWLLAQSLQIASKAIR